MRKQIDFKQMHIRKGNPLRLPASIAERIDGAVIGQDDPCGRPSSPRAWQGASYHCRGVPLRAPSLLQFVPIDPLQRRQRGLSGLRAPSLLQFAPMGIAPTKLLLLLLVTLLLAACGGSTSPQSKVPTPTPTIGVGQQLLSTVAQKLNTAQTLHGIFDIQITGQAFNGTVNTEVWNAVHGKYRTVVLQSSIAQFSTGTIDVSNGKTVWQYDPQQKVVYTGAVASNTSGGTPTPAANGGGGGGGTGSQVQFILRLVQSVFSQSDATLVSSSATVNGHSADEIQIVSQGLSVSKNSGTPNLSYTGNIFIDKGSNLPLQVNLTIQGFGQVTLNLPTLTLNQPIPDSTFTFVVPAGVKTLPLQQASTTPDSGAITLAQAQQQAGYHLLSIPSSQSGYTLASINALGSPGSQIYTLNYTKGSSSFTIAEGKSLANLPQTGGQQVNIRGTHGTISTANGTTTLTWTENGVGITITGPFSSNQTMSIAQILS